MGYKLLLADDSITIQKVVGIIFANEDYELTVVDNGDDALDKARRIDPDVILVDALMPGKSGYDVCSEAKRDPALKNTPLLLLVGAFEPFDEEKAASSGADDHISKPFESQHLTEKVRKLIDLRQERLKLVSAIEPAAAADFTAPATHETASFVVETDSTSRAEAVSVDQSVEDGSLNSLEVVEASPEDDLWGAFEVEEIDEEEEVSLGEVVEDEELPADIIDSVEEIDTFSLGEPEAASYEGEKIISLGEFPEERREIEECLEEECVFIEEPEFGDENASFGDVGASEATFGTASFEEDSHQETNPAVPGIVDFSHMSVEPAEFINSEEIPASIMEMEPVQEEEMLAGRVSADTAVPSEGSSGSVDEKISISESQLAAIIASVSKDLIEKIAWEVVPELAETIIREEIRKIKEGH